MNAHELLQYFGGIFAVSFALWYLGELHLFTYLCVIAGLSVISWTLANLVYENLHKETISPQNKAVLVTGCDTGFGNALAQRLDRFGFTVFAGVLFPDGDGAKGLKEQCTSNLRILKLDVTKQEDVEEAVKEIKMSNMPLWAVVNNAGIGFGVPFDWGKDVDDYQKIFDVNVFGMVRVTKNCIPLLRASQGRVINVASAAGRITVPGMSHYCMTKHSVRVFSDSIRRELSRHNISVVVIEPAFYKTPIVDFEQMEQTKERIFAQSPDDIRAVYPTELRQKMSQKSQANIEPMLRTNLNEVIDTMEAATTLVSPKLYYRCCGYLDILTIWAISHLPEVLLDLIFKYKG